MSIHHEARTHVVAGFQSALKKDPSLAQAQLLQGVGMLESGYGRYWKGPGKGSFNMGAITTGSSWKGKSFKNRDSYPDENGANHWYTTDFRKYDTAAAGWKDLAIIMYRNRPSVLEAAAAGDTFGVSSAMYESKYYTGFGSTALERIGGHFKSLKHVLVGQCQALNELMPSGKAVPPRTLKRGSQGEDVKVVQRALQLVADGSFGSFTFNAVVIFQKEAIDLKADGIVGPLTWEALLAIGVSDDHDVPLSLIADELFANATAFRGELNEFAERMKRISAELTTEVE